VSLVPLSTASPRANHNRVEYRRGPLPEWYVNGPLGLEQGFTVKVDCLNSMSRIAFLPSVSGSLWFTHGGSIGFASGSNGTQLSNQATDDVITAQFATTTHTTTMVISGHPAATCIYSAQAIVQP